MPVITLGIMPRETRGEREERERRLRLLVGSTLSIGAPRECIEATFRSRFGKFFGQPLFWDAFESACVAVDRRQPWHTTRQLMLSYSLPQEVNTKDELGETMMTLAAAFGRASVVSILCQIKGKATIENVKGWSSVHIAVANKHIAVLEAFVLLGVSVDEPGSRLGYAPLHLAASVDHVEVLQCLHATKKADFMKVAGNGYSILHVAAENGAERCVKFLTEHYPDLKHKYDNVMNENPAHKAAKTLQTMAYRHLATTGTRVDLENVEGDSAWHQSTFNERYSY